MNSIRLILWAVFFIAFTAVAVFFFRCSHFFGVLMKDPQVINAIREARETTEEIRACGEPPVDPWTAKPLVSKMDLDLYYQQKEIWERCVQRLKDEDAPGSPSSSQAGSPHRKLREFKESDRPDF